MSSYQIKVYTPGKSLPIKVIDHCSQQCRADTVIEFKDLTADHAIYCTTRVYHTRRCEWCWEDIRPDDD